VEGLNLGLAVNIADNASVNANKISSAIDRLMKLSNELVSGAKKTGSATDRLASDFNQTDRSARNAAAGVTHFGGSLERSHQHIIDFRAGIVRLFPYISLIGGLYAVKRAGEEVVDTTREIHYSLANMQAATGYSAQEMSMLEKQMRQMSIQGRFSMKEISDAGYDLSTTIPIASTALSGLTQSVLDYATATQYSVKESGLDMLALLSRMGRPLSDATTLFDQMAKATNVTSLTAERLSEMLKVTGTEASQAKVPFNEMLALMGQTDLYYKGSEGGTRLRMMFQQLAEGTEMQKKILAQSGLTPEMVDISKHGLFNVLQSLGGMTYGQLSRLVGGYSAGLILRLTQDVGRMKQLAAGLTEEQTKGTTTFMKNVQFNTLDGQIKNVENRMTDLKHSIGDVMEGSVLGSLKKMGTWLGFMSTNVQKNRGALQGIIQFAERAVDAVGNVLGRWVEKVSRFFGIVADTRDQSMNAMKNHLIPFLIFLEVASMRIGAFLKGFSEGFLTGIQTAWETVKPIVGWIGSLVGMVTPNTVNEYERWGKAIGFIAASWAAIEIATKGAAAAMWVWNTAMEANPIVAIVTGVLAAMYVLYNYWDDIKQKFRESVKWLATALDAIVNNLLGAFSPNAWMTYWLTGTWSPDTVLNLSGASWMSSGATGSWDQKSNGGGTSYGKVQVQGKTIDTTPVTGGMDMSAIRQYASMSAKGAKRGTDGQYHFGDITIMVPSGDPKEIAEKLVDEIAKRVKEKEGR
jgi:TP901 family phage tail tape measure protein